MRKKKEKRDEEGEEEVLVIDTKKGSEGVCRG